MPLAVVLALSALLVLLGPVAQGSGASRAGTQPYLSETVPVARGCIVLDYRWAGVKVYLVQRQLGVVGSRERYDAATYAAVRVFQRDHGLPVTGRVGRGTWRALHTGRPFCVDRFTVQPKPALSAGRGQRVETMLRWARRQLGLPYIWGGAGPIGYDCSGLVLQAVHAAGLVVPTITTYRHQREGFSSATAFYASTLRHLPLDHRRRGDLVFWGEGSTVTHVAFYLGDDRILEAVRPVIRKASLWSHSTVPMKPYVVRPFTAGLPRH